MATRPLRPPRGLIMSATLSIAKQISVLCTVSRDTQLRREGAAREAIPKPEARHRHQRGERHMTCPRSLVQHHDSRVDSIESTGCALVAAG
jgi:hypothetical protein